MVRKLSIIVLFMFMFSITDMGNPTNESVTPYFTEINSECEIKNDSTELVEKVTEKKPTKKSDFLTLLSYSESRHNWKVMNEYGYIGKYQMGKSCLLYIGYEKHQVNYIFKNFDSNPEVFNESMQDAAVKIWVTKLRQSLHLEIKNYAGKNVNGIYITESSIIAAAHLAGVQGVKKWFMTTGEYNPKDAYGTSIEKYMKKFAHTKINI